MSCKIKAVFIFRLQTYWSIYVCSVKKEGNSHMIYSSFTISITWKWQSSNHNEVKNVSILVEYLVACLSFLSQNGSYDSQQAF